MAMSEKAKVELVEEHIRAENTQDLARTMATFGKHPNFAVNNTWYRGRDQVGSCTPASFRRFQITL